MVVDSRRRDPVGFLNDVQQRLVALERRVVRGVQVTWDSIAGKPSTFPSTWGTVSGKPTGFSDVPPTVADLNTFLGPGWATANGTTANRPDSSLWFVVETTNSGGRATQFARTIDRTGVMYKRWLGVPGDTTSWTAWVAVGNETIEGWTDLQPYLGPGMTYSADGGPGLAGIQARRVGLNVELMLGNFQVASMSVPVNGNVANQAILIGIPTKFRPLGGAVLTAGWAGRMWSGYVDASGSAYIGAVVPDANATGTVTWTNQVYSGSALYPAATP